ncbi:MAG: lysylphosphatidylglycerol synthase domain-containing protein [Deltaproteobacteria bacterium]
MKKKLYIIVNLIFIFTAFYFLTKMITSSSALHLMARRESITYIIIAVLVIMLVHCLKALRFYLILFEQKIPFRRFIKLYIKTTFINITLPFKSFEIFRIYCYGREIKNYEIGILGVLIDRFFDTCVLIVILIPYEILKYKSLSILSFVILAFVLFFTTIYFLFPTTYRYFNKFLVLNVWSKNVIPMLEHFERASKWDAYSKQLLKGRASTILLLSCLAWGVECFALFDLSKMCGFSFTMNDFIIYLNSAFTIGKNELLIIYVCLSSIVFALITVIIYTASYIKTEVKKNEQSIMRI